MIMFSALLSLMPLFYDIFLNAPSVSQNEIIENITYLHILFERVNLIPNREIIIYNKIV